MSQTKTDFPDFDNPPVNEVVFSIQFETIKEFQLPHFGILWEKLGRDDYPNCQEVNLITHAVEKDKETKQTLSLPKGGLLPLPRVFFINSTGEELVQVQQDRFLRNWRKMKPDDSYPRYKTLLPKFEQSLESFEQFISEEFKGRKLEIDQYELTYVNHIYMDKEELSQSQLSKYFSVYRNDEFRSFLPVPEVAGWNMIYKLPNSLGRLHMNLSQCHKPERLFVLNITARGINEQKNMKSWLKVAHEWIIKGFADITGEWVQKNIWVRKVKE